MFSNFTQVIPKMETSPRCIRIVVIIACSIAIASVNAGKGGGKGGKGGRSGGRKKNDWSGKTGNLVSAGGGCAGCVGTHG